MVFINYKRLLKGEWQSINKSLLFPLLRWSSFNYKNAELSSYLDRISLKCDDKIVTYLLAKQIDGRMSKYLKSEKVDKELFDYLKTYFRLSSQELKYQLHLINVKDKELLKKISVALAWDKKTCKKYGVSYI